MTAADVERILDQLETVDLEAANLLRAYIHGLEGLALAGEMLEEEEQGLDFTIPRGLE